MTNPMKPSIATGMMPPSYGGGVGIAQNRFWKSRPVASGEYGIYPEKGEWDYDFEEEDENDIDDLDIKVSNKAFSSAIQIPNDTKTKPDHKSFGNLGSHNLVSHAEKSGNLLKEYIREALAESSISGRSYIRKSLGDPYKVDKTTVGSGIGRAKVSPKLRSVQIPGVTASGVKAMNQKYSDRSPDFDDSNDDESSLETFFDFDIDEFNLEKHNKRKFC